MNKNTNTRSNFERLHKYYQKRAYTVIIKEFRKIIKRINFDNIDYWNAEATIALNVNDTALKNAMYRMYLDVGLKYGRHVVRNLEGEKKAKKPYPLFSEKFIEFITNYMDTEATEKFASITETMSKKITTEIGKMQAEGLTQSQMAKAIEELVNKPNFYRYNAIRIVRTETAFAMNSAKVVSFESSDYLVRKVWIAGGSSEPRAGHLQMNGVEVGEDEPFTLPDGTQMIYPGDSSLGAGADNIINCSCSVGYRSVRDSEGNLVYK